MGKRYFKAREVSMFRGGLCVALTSELLISPH
jgi:hypothetical protein